MKNDYFSFIGFTVPIFLVLFTLTQWLSDKDSLEQKQFYKEYRDKALNGEISEEELSLMQRKSKMYRERLDEKQEERVARMLLLNGSIITIGFLSYFILGAMSTSSAISLWAISGISLGFGYVLFGGLLLFPSVFGFILGIFVKRN